jgi:hypothetical protein
MGFTLTQYRSYRDVAAYLVEEDLRSPSVHDFRHELAREVEPPLYIGWEVGEMSTLQTS